MGSSYKSIPVLTEDTVYSAWKKEIAFWKHATNVDPKKRAHTVILAMTGKPRNVATQLDPETLAVDGGLDTLITEMDKMFLKDNTQQLFCAIDSFEKFRRPKSTSMDEYIAEFTRLYKCVVECRSGKESYEDGILAYKMLMQADLSNDDQRIVKAIAKPLSVAIMTETLKRTFGDGLSTTGVVTSLPYKSATSSSGFKVKDEPLFLTRELQEDQQFYQEEKYDDMEGGIYWNNNPRRNYRSFQRGFRGSKPRGNYVKSPPHNNQSGRFNPYGRGSKKQQRQCFLCGDPSHYVSDCPHNSFKKSAPKDNKVFAVFEPDFNLPDCEEELVFLTGEATNQALLDTGACTTVCGKEWFQVFEQSLSSEEKEKIVTSACQRLFKFGDGVPVNSTTQKIIPLKICGKDVLVRTFLVDNDIPLLLSRQTMMSMGMIIDLDEMSIRVRDSDQSQRIEMTKSGHVVLAIGRCITKQFCEGKEKIMDQAIYQVNSLDPHKTAQHLHRYYAHASSSKIGKLLTKAKVENSKEIIEQLIKLEKGCDFCLKHKSRKKPHRKVGIPQGYSFNEVVAMDLKALDEGPLLVHLVDTVTRYSMAASINSKAAEEILDKIFRYWIAIFGIPRTFISDNGGEFVNNTFNQACSVLNINIKTSPAESPWCQGVVERHNGILGAMVKSVKEEVGCNLDIAISWAVNAKNSLSNTYGFSPHQLVFGSNPRVPSVLNEVEPLPTLNTEDIEAAVSDHLNALTIARQKFVELEASDRVKRSLKERVHEGSNAQYCSGDVVYFKRDNRKFWYGPAIVVGQVANNVLIKHGGMIIRSHPCKVVLKANADEEINGQKQPQRNIPEAQDDPDSDDEIDDPHPVSTVVHQTPEEPSSDQGLGESPSVHEESVIIEDSVNSPTSLENPSNSDSGWSGIADKDGSTKIKLTNGDVIRYRSGDDKSWNYGIIDSKVPKSSSNTSRNCFTVQKDNVDESVNVDLESCDVEKLLPHEEESVTMLMGDNADVILITDNANVDSLEVKEAKNNEVVKLQEFKTYKEVKDSGQSSVSSRWVITNRKNSVKARLVARGFEECGGFQTDAPTVSNSSLRIMYTMTASHGWKIQTLDITSAFLQSSEMTREVYLKPPADIRKKGILWKLLKPIYGLGDSPRRWYSTLKEHLLQHGCKISKLDKCIFRYYERGKLQGLITTHVDDLLYGGTTKFLKSVIGSVTTTFKISRMDSGIFTYLGWSVNQEEDMITVDQRSFGEKIKPAIITQIRKQNPEDKLSEDEKKIYQALLGKLLWLSGQTRPDLSYDVLELSTVAKNPTIRDLMDMNKVIKKTTDGPKFMRYSALDLYHEELKVIFYSDASLGKLPGKGSARGYLVFLSNGVEANLISWSSKKVKRVVHSTFGAETLACVDGSAAAIHVRQLLSEMLYDDAKSKVVPIQGYIDSKQLYDNINSTKQCEDKKMQLDIAELQESLELNDISSIDWVPTGGMLADCLTKKGASSDSLCCIVERGRFQ